MELLKLLSANEIAAQVVSFLLLLFLLRRYMWKPFLKVLDTRGRTVSDELKKIEDTKLEVEKMKADYEDKLSHIEDTARAKVEEAIREGRRVTDEIRADADDKAKKMIENAKAIINDELGKAKEDLRETVVDLALGAAEKVIDEKLTSDGDRKLVKDFLKNVAV